MVHYWVRHAKCTWSSFFSSSVHQFIFSEIGDTELGLVYVLKINNIIKGAKEGVYCLGTAFCLHPVVLMIGDNSIMRSWQNPVCLLQYCVRSLLCNIAISNGYCVSSCHCCAISNGYYPTLATRTLNCIETKPNQLLGAVC